MKILTTIGNFFTKKTQQQNNLYNIFKKYVEVSSKLNNLETDLKNIEIKKIENQINEYFISVSELSKLIGMDLIDEENLLTKVKHLSEIKPKNFSFVDLYASPVEEGILLTAEPTPTSESITIVSFIKKDKD